MDAPSPPEESVATPKKTHEKVFDGIDVVVGGFVRLNPILSHVGLAVASVAFTVKMVRHLPNDPFLWAVYMTSVGGVSALTDYLRARV